MSDVRTVQRDMRRAARILNAVFDTQAHTMCWHVLEEAPRLRDGVFEVRSHPCSKKLADEPMFPPDTSASTKKIFVSLNRCRQAILWNTGWLSIFARDLKFEIIERHLDNPKPTYPFVIHRPGEEMTFSEDYAHTVLLFRPGGSSGGGSSGIVADPSHAQCQFEHGIDTIADYIETKTKSSVLLDPFDSCHRDELFGDTMIEGMSMDSDTQSLWSENMNAAITGVTNNTIIAEVERLEGVPTLMSLSEHFFGDALHRLVASLNSELVALRRGLEVGLSNPKGEVYSVEFLQEILDGKGHHLCEQSFDQLISQLTNSSNDENVSAPEFL